MAYVPVPKDLSKIKTKLAFNLTKRQLICFSGAAAVGLPAYLFSRGSINEKQSLYPFKGKLLCWKASRRYFPRRRRNSAKKKLNAVFMRCSVSTGTGFTNHSQHCCPGLLIV